MFPSPIPNLNKDAHFFGVVLFCFSHSDTPSPLNLAPSPNVMPALAGRHVGVLAKVSILLAGGVEHDAEADVEDTDVPVALGAGRPGHVAGVGRPADVLGDSGIAVVDYGSRDCALFHYTV